MEGERYVSKLYRPTNMAEDCRAFRLRGRVVMYAPRATVHGLVCQDNFKLERQSVKHAHAAARSPLRACGSAFW